MKNNRRLIRIPITALLCLLIFISSPAAFAEEKEQPLKGKIICVDAGHQKKANNKSEPVAPGSKVMKPKTSSGTTGVATKVPEYKLNLEVALLLQKKLEALGAKVVMARTVNEVDISNAERAGIANKAKADLFLRIHADGSDSSKVNGVSLLFPGNKYIKDKKMLSASKTAAQKILDSVVAATKAKSRGLSERSDMTGFNWSKVPVVLIEMGFMTNREEDLKLNSKEYRDKLVNGMAKGIMDYFSASK